MDRRRLMAVTQALQMTVALFLVATTVAGVAGAWSIYAAAFAGGPLAAFDGPARQALIPSIVPNEDIENALTLNALIRQAATIVGPGIGGFCIAFLGPGATYGINALTFLAVIGALLAMTGVRAIVVPGGGNLQRVADGLKFALSEPLLLLAMLLDFTTRALGSPRGIMPVFAEDVFHVGAVAGGLVLGARPGIPRPMVWLLLAYLLEGLSNAGFALSPNAAIGWAMLCFGGVCNVVGEVLLATLVQLRTPDHLRGRTTALLNMLSTGGPQSGQIQIGFLASVWVPVSAGAFNGIASATVAAAFGMLAPIRNRLGVRRMTDLAVEQETTG
ncbi:MAG: MFS transporter [Dehalococcoidia bacterium]|nr:MFS transporter [Dehalococcoidia bacterium]